MRFTTFSHKCQNRSSQLTRAMLVSWRFIIYEHRRPSARQTALLTCIVTARGWTKPAMTYNVKVVHLTFHSLRTSPTERTAFIRRPNAKFPVCVCLGLPYIVSRWNWKVTPFVVSYTSKCGHSHISAVAENTRDAPYYLKMFLSTTPTQVTWNFSYRCINCLYWLYIELYPCSSFWSWMILDSFERTLKIQ